MWSTSHGLDSLEKDSTCAVQGQPGTRSFSRCLHLEFRKMLVKHREDLLLGTVVRISSPGEVAFLSVPQGSIDPDVSTGWCQSAQDLMCPGGRTGTAPSVVV